MSRWLTVGLVLVAAGALGWRLPQLDQRPLHADESVHAIKFLGLWERGEYRYDPHEYHGPSLYYLTLPLAWCSGATSAAELSELTLRLLPVLMGVGLILLLGLLADGLGRTAVLWAGVFTALSPALVFYNRYYIHETVLVFGALLGWAALWRYWRTRRVGWAVVAGGALGLMHGTKETFVFVLAAGAGAAVIEWAWSRGRGLAKPNVRSALGVKPLAAGAVAGLVVSVALFTSFFSHASGPADSLRTYLPWLARAGGNSPHVHPWHFYFERLLWFRPGAGPVFTEGIIFVLAAVGWVGAFRRQAVSGVQWNARLVRMLGTYTVLLMGIYTAVPYKTPWCALGFLHGLILLAGVGVATLGRFLSRSRVWARLGVTVLVGAGTVHLGVLSWWANHGLSTDQRNPYVYAHTSPDLLELVGKVKGVARAYRGEEPLVIKVMAPGGDYWPLPWYLREFAHVGWWAEVPEEPYAPVVIAGAKLQADLEDKSEQKWLMVSYFQQRPKTFLELYVEFELWKRYVESRPRPTGEEE
ncbi:MAG: TIGR03663 family protein [Verrucomicrobia bacterium]|nr:TIGR03663 family protein [Verrucomicrobiota bacterium]